jgi:hypothetical protein
VSGDLAGGDLIIDPLRALPKPMHYGAQLRQDDATHDVSVSVLTMPNRIRLESDAPHHNGKAVIDFLRRAD